MENRDDRAAYLEDLRRGFLCLSCLNGDHECITREEGVRPDACRCEACEAVPFIKPVDTRPVELAAFFAEIDAAFGNPPCPAVECGRCHEIVDDAPPVPRDSDGFPVCVPCHERMTLRWVL